MRNQEVLFLIGYSGSCPIERGMTGGEEFPKWGELVSKPEGAAWVCLRAGGWEDVVGSLSTFSSDDFHFSGK